MVHSNGSNGPEIIKNGRVAGKLNDDLFTSGARRPLALPAAYTPFPVVELPEPLRSFVTQGAAAIGPSCDPAFVALPALAVVASLIGATRVLALKRTWKEPAVLWPVIIGDSGTLKSPAMMLAVNPLLALQYQLAEEHQTLMLAHEKQKEDHQRRKHEAKQGKGLDPGSLPSPPVERRVICNDTTIEALVEVIQQSPQGVLLWQDELDAWFQSFKRYKSGGGSDRPQWLSIHGARSIMHDRKTGDKRRVTVPRAAVSVTGGMQPGVLAQCLDAGAWESGLGARLLLAYPLDLKKCWTDSEIHPDVEAAYANLLFRLSGLAFHTDIRGRQQPRVINLSHKAKELWVDYYNSWAQVQFAAEGQLRAAFSKIEAYAARLALVWHVVTHTAAGSDDCEEISADAIYAGIKLAHWFANEARRIYQVLGESEDTRRTRRLVEWIRQQGGEVTVRELRRSSPGKYQTTQDAEDTLQDLVAIHAGDWLEIAPGKAGGRPTRVFQLTIDKTDKTSPAERRPEDHLLDETTDETSPDCEKPS
jgi:hypothetical protein